MPSLHAAGIRHFYRFDGNEDKPAIVLVHSLGCDHSLWDRQAADLLPHFRVLRYDVRGHGATESTSGDYSIAQLANDTLAIADHFHLDTFAYCGLSMGGMIGQWLGANVPHRLTDLVLANTSARFPAPEIMEGRRKTALKSGMSSFAETALARGFRPETLASAPPFVGSMRSVLLATNPVGYAGCCAALRDLNQVDLLARIATPTLVIGGDCDVSTPWNGNGDLLANTIPGARSIVLPAAHLSNLEQPEAFSQALLNFVATV